MAVIGDNSFIYSRANPVPDPKFKVGDEVQLSQFCLSEIDSGNYDEDFLKWANVNDRETFRIVSHEPVWRQGTDFSDFIGYNFFINSVSCMKYGWHFVEQELDHACFNTPEKVKLDEDLFTI
jgi:hypothetical protein